MSERINELREYSISMKSGNIISGMIRDAEVLEALLHADAGWAWFCDEDGVIYVRAEEVVGLFIGHVGHHTWE